MIFSFIRISFEHFVYLLSTNLKQKDVDDKVTFGTMYSRMDQVKFMEDRL